MRMHIELDDDLVAQIDQLSGPRRRSGFVREAIEQALDRERRRQDFLASAGTSTGPHEWDDDPAEWVRAQRRSDPRRAG